MTTPMNNTTDKAWHEGWRAGYTHALDDIRQDLLALEADTGAPVPLAIYETINNYIKKLDETK